MFLGVRHTSAMLIVQALLLIANGKERAYKMHLSG